MFALVALIFIVIAAVAFVYLAPETTTRAFINVERYRAGLVRREIDLPDGLHYVYLEGGQGEPLMLLHGFGGNKDNFTRVARYLTPRYRVIIPDHIGFGESAHPPEADYSPVAQAERLHAFTQALGIQTVHVGGNSMGGQIAMTYASLHPAQVKSLWLIDAAGAWNAPESEVRKIIRETGQNPLMVRSEDDFAKVFTVVMNDPPFVPRPIMNVMAQERIRNAALEERVFGQIVTDSVDERINGLTIPCLIVWGDRDRVINVGTADVLHKLLPNSKVVIMPGVGHVPMIERPAQSADDYLQFRSSF
jgi:pimeloyl-ACP methyl ester carboxylesterase